MAQESVISETAGKLLPNFSMAGLGSLLLYGFISLLVIALIGVGVYFLVQRMQYNKKIILWAKIGGKLTRIQEDTGKFERVGISGDQWCRLRKAKKILPRPRIAVAKNEFWFYQRKDGEWINFDLEDIDDKFEKASIKYDDEDMRLQRLGIQKNLIARFQKATFWQKYGGMIMSLIFVLVVAIMFILLFKTMGDSWVQAGEMAEAVKEMANQVQKLSTRVGGGAVPV